VIAQLDIAVRLNPRHIPCVPAPPPSQTILRAYQRSRSSTDAGAFDVADPLCLPSTLAFSEWRVIRPKIRTLPSKEDPCDGAGRRRSGRRLPKLEPWAHADFRLGDCARRDAFRNPIVQRRHRPGDYKIRNTLHLSSPRPPSWRLCRPIDSNCRQTSIDRPF